MSKLKVALIGLGSRGNAYAACCRELDDRIEIVACADIIPDKLERFANTYGVPKEGRFNSAEELLEKDRLADVLFICTMDRQHYAHSISALNKGYNLLLEKPISNSAEECFEIARVAKEKGLFVSVCHVLRYTPYYRKLKEIIDSGVIGDVVAVQANEQTVFWHYAHSFVRGNWRDSSTTVPTLLQKSCHDMDILLWIVGKHCKSVSSFGSLKHFKRENAPAGTPERCSEACPAWGECPYSIKACYLDRAESVNFTWPMDVVCPEANLGALRRALDEGQYGRCVYYCDNNVCDHQVVNLLLEDDVTVSFTVSAFTYNGGRKIHVMGTKGDIVGDSENDSITVGIFGKEQKTLQYEQICDKYGHGGGDFIIIKELYELFERENKVPLSAIDVSIESHLICMAAEDSRVSGGAPVQLDGYEQKIKW